MAVRDMYLDTHLDRKPVRSQMQSGSAVLGCRPKGKRRGIYLLLQYLVAVFFLLPYPAEAQVKQVRRVLILNDLGVVSSPGYAEIDQAILARLQKSPYRIELYVESLELTLFPDEAFRRHFREEFERKYSSRKPDVVIAAGLASFTFLAELNRNLFEHIPVVYCINLGDIPDQLTPDLHFTGVSAKLHPKETLDAALRLLPGTKHVVVTGGMGQFDNGFLNIAKQAFKSYESKLDFTYLTDLTMPDLIERLNHLPRDTIVYHTAITQDAAGERFIDSTQSVPLVVGASNAPVFVMDDVDFRGGGLGGDLVNWAEDSRIAADLAVRILNGEKPEDIPIVRSNDAYMFDWRGLQRWGLKESNLPRGSIILNKPPSFWQLYKRYALAAFLVILGQALAIIALLRQRARKRKAEAELVASEEKFSKTFRDSPLVLAISTTSDSRFIELNESFEELTGWKRDEVLGRTPEELQLWANADQRAAFLNQIQTNGSIRDLEAHLRRKDGEIRTLLVSAEVVDVAGQRCTLSVGADITERKHAEQALRRKDAELAEAQRLAKLASWRWDVATDTVTWSEELYRISGRDPKLPAPSYQDHPKLYTAESWDRLKRAVEEALHTGAPYELDLEMVRPDGTKRWLFARGETQRDNEGRIVQLHGTVQDIAERKAAEDELRYMSGRLITAHEEERTRIARELHDDLSQRMALLQISVQQFEQGATGLPSMAQKKLKNIAEIASEISSDIHDLSHRLHPTKLDIIGLVPSLTSFCREFSKGHQLRVNFSHDYIPNEIPKDVTLCLFRVVQEALQNVVKHSGASEVDVELSGLGDRIELCVSDSGVGFNPESEKGKEGLGLLSMSERLRLIGGDLTVESEPSHGTRIRVRISLPATGAQITNMPKA